MALLEIACFNPESAEIADGAGADRIELCDGWAEGGTTPPIEWLRRVKAHTAIPVFVMIRIRGGDFTCTESEFEQMRSQIEDFRSIADGFVLGILDHDQRIDVGRTAELVRKAHPLPCTFHRAFDEVEDPVEAMESVIAAGCQAILTSGGSPNAHNGIEVLQTLVRAAGKRISIIAAGGVRSRNLANILSLTGVSLFHSSAILDGAGLPDVDEIQKMRRSLPP